MSLQEPTDAGDHSFDATVVDSKSDGTGRDGAGRKVGKDEMKVLSGEEIANALVATLSILNAAVATTGLLHDTLMQFRKRGVRFVVGDATVPDAESDKNFDEVCEVLRMMGEGIPQQIASALLEGDATPQNAPSVNTVQ